jgi:diguanylate cyclase (GGDEF)-like protein
MAFSDILRHSIRVNDTAGRWGGEEFLIVLPHTSVDAAAQTAEKIRTLVASGDYGEVKTVTASFGVLAHKPGETVDDLLLRADMALYAAKRKGRNAVVSQ